MAINRDRRLEQREQRTALAENNREALPPSVPRGSYLVWTNGRGEQWLLTGDKDGGVLGVQLTKLR